MYKKHRQSVLRSIALTAELHRALARALVAANITTTFTVRATGGYGGG